MMERSFSIRPVCKSDVDAILSILKEVACRVPINLSTPQHVEALTRIITERYLGTFSLTAVGKNGKVVGFQLARKIVGREEAYLDLAYAAVTTSSASSGIFRKLIETEKKHRLPLIAEVKPGNKSGMRAILMHYGFEQQDKAGTEFRWNPD